MDFESKERGLKMDYNEIYLKMGLVVAVLIALYFFVGKDKS